MELQKLATEDNLARRIAKERKKRPGLSQEKLAEKVEAILGGGFPQSAVSKIEKDRGRRAITVDEALALSRVFEIPLLEMLVPPESADLRLRRLLIKSTETMAAITAATDAHVAVLDEMKEEMVAHPELADALVNMVVSPDPVLADAFTRFLSEDLGLEVTFTNADD